MILGLSGSSASIKKPPCEAKALGGFALSARMSLASYDNLGVRFPVRRLADGGEKVSGREVRLLVRTLSRQNKRD